MGSRSVRSWVAASIVCGCWTAPELVAQSSVTNVASEVTATPTTARVTISAKDVPLRLVLQEIAKQARLTSVYGNLARTMARPITMQVQQLAVAQAFEKALEGTGIKAVIVGDQVVFTANAEPTVIAQGAIQGKIISAKTKAPLAGVTVSLDGNRKGVSTDNQGMFRFSAIAVGSHVVNVRMLGYAKAQRTINVVDGETAALDIVLEPSISTLDQVVVTGTVVATEQKAVPNAITVITAKQLEERGITRIDQLFRGDVPGLFAQTPASNRLLDEVVMYSRGTTTAYGFSSQGTSLNTNPIKTYVDGIEMADPKFLSQIDPKNIERIEILTGPQASTIYGSNAINGVMQIFTKRGATAQPQLTLNLLSGVVQNNFRTSLTPQHDYGAQLAGLGGPVSYSGGLSWGHMGAWTPARRTVRLNMFGAARFSQPTPVGSVTLDASLRRGSTTNKQHGGVDATWIDLNEVGYYRDPYQFASALDFQETNLLNSQALGFTLGLTPMSWWSHELSFGQDAEDTEYRRNLPKYMDSGDTLLVYSTDHTVRNSIRYTTTARVPVSTHAQVTATFGIDGWNSLRTNLYASTPRLTKDLGSVFLGRNPTHNRGGFVQTQLALFDQLFLTYGLRAEWNPAFGSDANPSYAPRYGVAYSREVGPVTAKVRASYGRSTRPPPLDQKLANPASPKWDADLIKVYGQYDLRVANLDLGPESQQGGEGGLELYFGGRASLVVTRFNQTVNGLITSVPGGDSVRSLNPDPIFFGAFTCGQIVTFRIPTMCSSQDEAGYGYAWQQKNINAASIRNQGWELQGTVITGPLTTHGTYSWTKSRTIGVTAQYLSRVSSLARFYPQYMPGQSFDFLPEHTWALGTTYARGGTTVSLNVTGVGKLRSTNDQTFVEHLDGKIRLIADRWRVDRLERYVNYNDGYAQADLTASQRFTSKIDGILQIQNLTNFYAHDFGFQHASLGRQSKAGFRIRM